MSLVVTTQIICIFPPQKIEPPATVYNHTILSIRAFELTNKIILRRNKKSKHSTTTVPRVNKHRGRQLLCTQLYAIQYYYYFCSTYDPWLPPISLRLLLRGDGMLIPADYFPARIMAEKTLKVSITRTFCMLVTLCERVLFLLLLFVRKQIFLSL